MPREYIRTFQEYDLIDVQKHLLILGDLTADCASCRELGLETNAQTCPNCGCQFKYITSRRLASHPGERFQLVKRYKNERPDLAFIDHDDYTKLIGKKQARDFFG